jgi:transposase
MDARKCVGRRSTLGSGLGLTSEDHAELTRLRRENAELRRANEILKAASSFFAAELDRPQQRS